jgi:acyl-CoA thioesterase II
MDLVHLFDLEPHGPDTFVGAGPQYPWGGLFGGQIVAQALRAATATVDDGLLPHSLRAYFIRSGDHGEPIRFEVDRIRNGRSFATRRVVARQSIGAILNLEASFQRPEASADISTVPLPADLPRPDDLADTSWSPSFDRRWVPAAAIAGNTIARDGAGRTAAWLRVKEALGNDELLQRCWLAFLSDDLPTDAVVRAHPVGERWRYDDWPTPDQLDGQNSPFQHIMSASLDHTVWFHRPVRADEWHLHEFSCHNFSGGRGLALGHVFAFDGTHVATVAQEVVMRDRRLKTQD